MYIDSQKNYYAIVIILKISESIFISKTASFFIIAMWYLWHF